MFIKSMIQLYAFVFFLTMFSSLKAEEECDKWKSEFASIILISTQYAYAFNEFSNKKITKEELRIKAEIYIEKIKKVEKHLEETASCKDDKNTTNKYESRKKFLLKSIAYIIPTMVTGEYLGPEFIDSLKKDPEQKDTNEKEKTKKTQI